MRTERVPVSLETILTSPKFFGLETASPVQRAICRAADGRELGELADHPDVIEAFGGPDAVAALPRGERPDRVDVYSGIRTGKSLLAAASSVCMSQRLDVSGLREGEIPRIPIVSLDLDKSRVVAQHIIGTCMAKPLLRALVIGDPTDDSILIRHPSGRVVEICPVAASRAGGAVVARWLGGLVLDELPRMLTSAEGFVVNVDDLLTSAEGRILPGGGVWGIGSPWAPWGEAFESVRDHFGKPTRERVVVKCHAASMNPAWWTPSRVEAAKRDPRAFASNVLGDFVSGASAAFDSDDVAAAFLPRQGEYDRLTAPLILLDPAGTASSQGGGQCVFAFALASWCRRRVSDRELYLWEPYPDRRAPNGIGQRRLSDANGNPLMNPSYGENADPFLSVWAIGGFDREARRGLLAAHVVDEVLAIGRRHGANTIISDQYNSAGLESLAVERRAKFVGVTVSAPNKKRSVAWLRNLLRERRISIAPHAGMHRELTGLQELATSSGGFTYGGRSTDFVSTLITAGILDLESAWGGSPTRTRSGWTESLGYGDFAPPHRLASGERR
jgi:hypothetical protein